MSLDRAPPCHPNPNTGGGSDRGKKKRAREAGREGSTELSAGARWSGLHRHVRHRVRWGGRGGDGVLGGDPVGGADLVGGGEAHEDDLDDGAVTNSIYYGQTIVKIPHAYIQNILADPFNSIHQKLTVTKSLNRIANVNQEIRRKVVKPWQPRHLDKATLSGT